jgi:nucleoside-diphosphate-sugar epimerase
MKILVIGGSRFVGPLVVSKLLDKGYELFVFNRGQVSANYPKGVTFIKGDRNDGFSITGHFDVVIDMCAYNGKQTATALKELSFDYFVHFGTIASYKKTEIFPLSEDSPSGDWPFMGDYNKGKVECEQTLEASNKKYASIRPTYILGPDNYIARESFIYQKINNGEPLILPGNGQALTQYIFSYDVANIILLLVEKQITGAFNCAGDELITLKGLVEYMATIIGTKADIRYNMDADGDKHVETEFPFANENLVFSNQKIKNLGFNPTSLFDGLCSDFDSFYKSQLR